VGGRYSDDWHRAHLMNPRDVVPESVMPGYPWFEKNKIDGASVQQRMQMLKNVFGHPYTDEEIANAPKAVEGKTEMDAVIAYLQGMGTTIKTVK
jgi:cytochrome c oxidase cbb3-type subunit 2